MLRRVSVGVIDRVGMTVIRLLVPTKKLKSRKIRSNGVRNATKTTRRHIAGASMAARIDSRLIELLAAVTHGKRQLSREGENGASLAQSLLTKPNGFRCLSFLAAPSCFRLRVQQRQPHRFLALADVAMFGLIGNERLDGFIVLKLHHLKTRHTVVWLTRLDHLLDTIVIFPLNPRMSTGERVDV